MREFSHSQIRLRNRPEPVPLFRGPALVRGELATYSWRPRRCEVLGAAFWQGVCYGLGLAAVLTTVLGLGILALRMVS